MKHSLKTMFNEAVPKSFLDNSALDNMVIRSRYNLHLFRRYNSLIPRVGRSHFIHPCFYSLLLTSTYFYSHASKGSGFFLSIFPTHRFIQVCRAAHASYSPAGTYSRINSARRTSQQWAFSSMAVLTVSNSALRNKDQVGSHSQKRKRYRRRKRT